MKKTKTHSLFAINTAVCAAVALAFSSCEKAKDAADAAGEGVKEAGEKVAEGAKATGEAVKDGAKAAGEAVKEAVTPEN